jgi:LysM repeat protein
MKSQTLGLVLGLNVAVACLVLQGCKANKPGSVKPAQDNVVVIDTNEPSDIKDEKPVNNAPETIVVEDEKPVTPVVVKPVPATPPPAPKKQITVVDKAPAASTETTTYVVCAGDTLSGIAARYNIKMQAILAVNPGMNPNRIYVGKKIKLPGKVAVTQAPVKKVAKASATPATAAKTTAPVTTKKATPAYKGATKEYTVKSGDILGKIAQSYGISIRALKELNGLKNNNIRVGQVLKVPAEKVVKKEAPKKPAKVDTANEVAIEPKKDVKKPAEAPAKVEEKKVETESATTVTTVEEVTVAPQVEAPAPDPKATEVAAPAPEQAAAPAAAQASTYVVKEGQDILSIAVDFGISPTQLLDANNLKMTDPIKPGDVLKLPAGVKPANAQ